jgi:hypothetical protein
MTRSPTFDVSVSFRQGHPDQHVARGAEILHLGIGESVSLHLLAQFVEIGRLRVAHLEQRAAGEFDGEMQALVGQEKHSQEKCDQ